LPRSDDTSISVEQGYSTVPDVGAVEVPLASAAETLLGGWQQNSGQRPASACGELVSAGESVAAARSSAAVESLVDRSAASSHHVDERRTGGSKRSIEDWQAAANARWEDGVKAARGTGSWEDMQTVARGCSEDRQTAARDSWEDMQTVSRGSSVDRQTAGRSSWEDRRAVSRSSREERPTGARGSSEDRGSDVTSSWEERHGESSNRMLRRDHPSAERGTVPVQIFEPRRLLPLVGYLSVHGWQNSGFL
jgi:hypothetical protein